jgi:hypothetical protein
LADEPRPPLAEEERQLVAKGIGELISKLSTKEARQ